MNILIITTLYPAYPNHSIQETSYVIHNFALFWKKDNKILVIRPYIKSKNLSNNLDNEIIIDGIKVLNLPILNIPGTRIRIFRKIYKALYNSEYNPDVLIAHRSTSYRIAYNISKRKKIPLILGIHSSDIKKIKSKKKYLLHAAGIACRSYSIYSKVSDYFPGFKHKLFTAFSGIDKNIIESKNIHFNKLKQWKSGKKLIFVTASILEKYKNIEINIKALKDFDRKTDWEYRIIGDGSERGNLERLVKECGLEEKVKFKGMKSRIEVLNELKLAHIFIMVSCETLGLAYFEAMAKGNIVIGTKNWGIDGIIEHGKNGFLCKARDESELLSLINMIVFKMTESELEEIQNNAYDTINKYTTEHASDNYLRNIKKFIGLYRS